MTQETRHKPAQAPLDGKDTSEPGKGARSHLKKGQQARDKIKAAAVRLLDRHGYHQLRITELAREAGVANGLFYHYFSSLDELVEELVDEFLARFEDVEDIEKDVPRGDWFRRILSHYQLVVDTCADYPGLFRCVRDLGGDNPALRERWQRSYLKQLDWLVDALPRVFPGVILNREQARLLVYGLGSVGEQLAWGYYIDRDPVFTGLQLEREQVAEWLAAIYYRGLFASNPPAGQLRHAAVLEQLQRRENP